MLSSEAVEKDSTPQVKEINPIRIIKNDSDLFKKEIFDGIELPIHVDGTYHGFVLFF